jgi:hypothetical protein
LACQAEDGELRRTELALWLRACWLGSLLAVLVGLCGCAVPKFSNPFSTGSESASNVTEDKLLETAKADSADTLPGGMSPHCPQVVAWPNDRLLTVYEPGHNGDILWVIHRGEITKLSRDCQIYSDRVIVKYGFAGRVLLGPKGKPGTVTMPVKIRAAGADKRTLATDKMTVSVTVPQNDPVGYFSMVREMSFPIQVGTRPEDYKIFVAFDKKG